MQSILSQGITLHQTLDTQTILKLHADTQHTLATSSAHLQDRLDVIATINVNALNAQSVLLRAAYMARKNGDYSVALMLYAHSADLPQVRDWKEFVKVLLLIL